MPYGWAEDEVQEVRPSHSSLFSGSFRIGQNTHSFSESQDRKLEATAPPHRPDSSVAHDSCTDTAEHQIVSSFPPASSFVARLYAVSHRHLSLA